MLNLPLTWVYVICVVFTFLCEFSIAGPFLANPRDASSSSTTFGPVSLALGTGPLYPTNSFRSFQLTSTQPVATLDYGHEVAGYPIFDIAAITGKVQIEVKYTEPFAGLSQPFSDGPYPYAVTLSNSYRVETFEVTKAGPLQAYLLQGGQRWQSIRLLTNGTITFSNVGFKASISMVDVGDLPGSFESDNELLNKVWELGARAVSAACVEKGTQKAIWEVSGDGAFVTGMRPGLSAKAATLKDYTLEFDVKIERAGMGWAVAFPLAYPGQGIQLDIVGELPGEATFVNTNTSLTPANSILLGYGYSFVNQTTLTSYHLDTFKIPFSVHEQTWYTLKTVLSSGQYLAVFVNGTKAFNTSLADYYIGGSSISTIGSFGFGGWQDQSSYIKNVIAYDTANGTILYSNPMTDPNVVLPEYGVHENYASVCLDGAKRDRLVWLGDFYHTAKIIAASTSRFDLVKGTLQYFLDWQRPNGLLPYDPPMGYDHSIADEAFSIGGGGALAGLEVYGVSLPDYQILGLKAFTDYVSQSNDLSWTRATWPKWQLQVNWLLSQINSTTGLLSMTGFAILGPTNGGSAISCALLEALNNVALVATALNDTRSAAKYQTASTSLSTAINKLLWDDELGIYSLSPSSPNDYSVAGLSFCITSGAANATQTARSLSALSALKLGPGYKDSTQINSSDPTVNLSPNTNGFLLAALLSQNATNDSATALELITSLWGAMLSNNETNSGASWEYVDQQGNPGLSLFTSLSHPWGGAPTYILTQYAAGIQQAGGVAGFGHGNWVINPSAGLAMGLKKASAKVVTAFGGNLEVQWKVSGEGVLSVTIKSPRATSGVFELNGTQKVLRGSDEYAFTVKVQ
ncbi:related to alpha-L-rhamnosidase A [Phialocephala subalpina]|uniref:Related to alpha-L-rhamnosidase A n=1 Tax=Phialocephala subalpina TaxID=576137 RepID=A0A1L7XCF4_9HELO|nr:related to alpha-L-rhamnosidase A [Phialocephala subalpina]